MSLLLALHGVTKQYASNGRTVTALHNISLSIYAGEILGLLGVNGAGKTTLSSLIATLHPVTGGQIMHNDRSVYEDVSAFRSIIGFCPQKPNLNNSLTVRQNLERAGAYMGLSKQETQARIAELAVHYSLSEYLDAFPATLSGGYKQRVSIARALLHRPKLVILDEPTVGLDPHIRRQLWESIKQLKQEGITVILTTHYLDEAEQLSDRICILEKGQIKLIDTPQNLKSSYQMKDLESVFLHLMDEKDSL